MAKRTVGKSGGGRGRPPGSGRASGRPTEPEGPDLLETLQAGLTADGPLELLATVSGLITVTDPREADPFHADERPSLHDLVDSFLEIPTPETTAVLSVIRAVIPDEVMRARIGRGLARRTDPEPAWLAGLERAQIDPEVWFLGDPLGDGDDYFLGATLPTGHRLSAFVYVDHNLGTAVKDAYVMPEPLTALVEQVGRQIVDSDQVLTRVDPAQARAVLEQAIDDASRLYPPVESDSWPICRPIIEWMLRMLPAGGSVPAPPEWSQADLAQLADDFFASSYGASLDDQVRRILLESVLRFGTDYGPGDPLRWSPVAVERLLLDGVPSKIIADPALLAQLPGLLRAFVPYAHGRREVRQGLTWETLLAIDALDEPCRQRARMGAPAGSAALLERLLAASGGQLPEELIQQLAAAAMEDMITDDELGEVLLEELADQVGGPARLAALTAEPLPDEAFTWAEVPADIHSVVEEVLTACDGCADALLDVEHRTAMRRFLNRIAVADPAIFRRKASPVRGAAAVALVICRANSTVGAWPRPLTTQNLVDWFGVTSSAFQRADPMLRAVGAHRQLRYGDIALGTPDLLVSTRRAEIIEQRERLLAE